MFSSDILDNFSETTPPSVIRKIWADLEKREDQLKAEEDAERADAVRADCESLYEFVRRAWPILERKHKFVGGWALKAMCDHLEAVTRGDIQYLLINVPPGMMKSLLVSVFWPAWEWGPMGLAHMRYLTCSYAGNLALRDNVKMRRLVESDWYQMLWPEIRFARDQNAKQKFENTETGGRECKSFEGMTGGRGDRVIIDDPHSVDGGDSDVQRESAVQTFRESITDRMNDVQRSAIVIIMQRIHEGDVSGTILALELPYVHLCLPMEYEPARHCRTFVNGQEFFSDPRTEDGELLFPERFPRAEMEQMKIKKGAYAYAGQYQQRPAPRDGGMFQPDNIDVIDELPGDGIEIRGWDIAGSTRKTSPWTVGAKLMLFDGQLVITDIKRARKKILEAERLIINTAKDDRGVLQSIPQDPGSAGKSQKAHLAKKLQGRKFKFSVETGSKEFRAQPFAAQVNAGNVSMLRGPWNGELIDEMRNFPASMYKDQIDALSRAYYELLLDYEDELPDIIASVHGGQEAPDPNADYDEDDMEMGDDWVAGDYDFEDMDDAEFEIGED